MGLKIVRGGIVVIVLLVAFFLYSYFFGSMYGGRSYQRQSFSAEARLLLAKYQEEQAQYFKSNNKFDRNLKPSVDPDGFKDFKLGFNDVDPVSKYCPDCTFSDRAYKVAAYGKFKGEDVIWSVDNNGTLAPVRE
jgi:hypothetical protein